jgi:hypothetical protein
VGHGYGILPITTDVSPMAHAHNQAPGFRLFPRVRLKATKMDDRTLELWNFQRPSDLRNTPFPTISRRSRTPRHPPCSRMLFKGENGRFSAEP